MRIRGANFLPNVFPKNQKGKICNLEFFKPRSSQKEIQTRQKLNPPTPSLHPRPMAPTSHQKGCHGEPFRLILVFSMMIFWCVISSTRPATRILSPSKRKTKKCNIVHTFQHTYTSSVPYSKGADLKTHPFSAPPRPFPPS